MADGSSPRPAPTEEYGRRLTAARETAERATARADRFSNARLACLGLALLLGVLAFQGVVSGHLLWIVAGLFLVLVALHQQAVRLGFEAERRAKLYERGLDRIGDRWAGVGPTGERWRGDHELMADDLDLFGEGSLFQLLCTVRTQAGEQHLARWLVEGAPLDVVRARQEAVEELRPAVDLREDLAIVGDEVHGALDREGTLTWATADVRLAGRVLPWVVRVLGVVTTTLCMGWLFGPWPVLPFLVSAVLQFLLVLPWMRRVESVLDAADQPSRDLDLVARLLERFERASFSSSYLRDLESGLSSGGTAPSKAIARLTRLVDFVEARRNQIFLPLSWLLGLGTQLAFAIESWRAEFGHALVDWVDTLGTLEAVVALSAYAYEHPADPFPSLVDEGATFDGQALGHPLLPSAENVRNDVRLQAPSEGDPPQALLVSGSNMSGKSTLLRTVGINVVLALAGAPVRAGALRVSPLGVGASIRVNDSLREGESRFYAEIARLRRIVDLARERGPALFLLDEMLAWHQLPRSPHRRRGRDPFAPRRGRHRSGDDPRSGPGARSRTAGRACGTCTSKTSMEDGRMRFDYRMRPGVVTRSNAIELMRAVGLDV